MASGRLSSVSPLRLARWVGAALALAALVGMSFLGWRSRTEALDAAMERSRLVARVVEDHATLTIEAAALALSTVGDGIRSQQAIDPDRLSQMLGQTVLGQPTLREAALLSESGQIIASSAGHPPGSLVRLAEWGPLPTAEGKATLMHLQPGRGLLDGRRAQRIDQVSYLPLVLPFEWRTRRLFLVALINPDALANYQQGVAEPEWHAALFSYQGQLLAATTEFPLKPGSWQQAHRLFREALPSQAIGEWQGRGFSEGEQLLTYRVSRSRPMVVVVEQDRGRLLADWRESLWWNAGALLVMELLILGGMVATLRALSTRAQAQTVLDEAYARLSASEQEMALVLRSIQELIFRTNAQGELVFVNARWSLITREPSQNMLGRKISSLAAPSDRAVVEKLFSHSAQEGVRHAEVTVPISAGEHRRFSLAVVPLMAGQQIDGFAGSAVDVTERFAAEARLQHQLQLVALLLELSPQPTSMVDREGCYVTVNRAWEDFTGRRREEVVGKEVDKHLPECGMEPPTSDWVPMEGIQGQSLLRYETQFYDRNHDCRDVVLSKVVVPGDGRGPAGVLFTLTDVSEFRRAERATMEAKEAAEEASRVKSEFIANMSHELRTPLQSIIGYSELGRARGEQACPKLSAMFGDIHDSGRRMLDLVNDLLDVSALESGVGTFSLERCDIRPHITAVLRELKPLMTARRLALDMSQAPEPLVARVDPLRFQQVIRNVLANAIRFSPEGSAITVRTIRQAQGHAHLAIMDRGPGIPEPELERIFEAFVQSSATSTGAGGTGLGLAICRKIMTALGGRIYAENRPGGGAVFHVLMPLGVVAEI
jgi:PAS domain S-box-containing protein